MIRRLVHELRLRRHLLRVDGGGVLDVVLLGGEFRAFYYASEVLGRELFQVLRHISLLRRQVVAPVQVVVYRLPHAPRITLPKQVLTADAGDEAAVARNALVSDFVLGAADPALCIPRVVPHRHSLLVFVVAVEHGLLGA
eukprot:CAMPEP_0202961670 /NCGR_PEP_ID=MMETSP1396-20130829/5741_1 /ASSEMBLY_ACC=CAM_ASM_000872 /TAXON_ID= /ORGANISM="Pseudokeronopsis sp., Strain Brazil" /LENGTH=139 /DNA_ID=CAMNT_0049681673 /DNA_START=417 /DNA_END=836 /DNA_ORIENTATION=-